MPTAATTFRTPFVAGWLISLVLVAGIAATAIVALRLTTARQVTVARELVDDLSSVQRLRLQAERVVAATRGYLLTGANGDQVKLDTARADFEVRLAELRALKPDPDGSREAASVERAARTYMLATHGAADFEASVSTFADHERVKFDTALAHAQGVAQVAQLALVVAALAAIVLGIVLAVAMIRRQTAQIARLHITQASAEAAASAREEILAVVSHDLRNPLHAIQLGASLLDETASDERMRKHIATVHNAATRMQHMIDELVEAAQLDAAKLVLRCAECDATRLLDETLELFSARAAAQQVELTAVPADADARLIGDRERLLEILSNLLGNALKFTPRGGRIVVSVERLTHEVRFAVADTGPGIAPDQLSHLFERYWQGNHRQAHAGLGLGLYICKRLVDAHHGSIGVDSTLGTGTTFWFKVPAPACLSSERAEAAVRARP